MKIITSGVNDRFVTTDFNDHCVFTGKCITMLHNHILDDTDTCVIAINVPTDRDIIWSYDLILPYIATVEFHNGAVFTGGTPIAFNNKDLGNDDNLGITGVYDPVVTDQGNLYDSTRYGAETNPNTLVGTKFGSGWFRLNGRIDSFVQTITSHYAANNVVTRFTFMEI